MKEYIPLEWFEDFIVGQNLAWDGRNIPTATNVDIYREFADKIFERFGHGKSKFLFGDIVVVDDIKIGVVVKTWERSDGAFYYEVYVRLADEIIEYEEKDIERYRIRHKCLSEEEHGYQNN